MSELKKIDVWELPPEDKDEQDCSSEVEHLPYKEGVTGSTPVNPTIRHASYCERASRRLGVYVPHSYCTCGLEPMEKKDD